MDAAVLHDISGVTGQPCRRRAAGGGGGGGGSPQIALPFAGDVIQPPQATREASEGRGRKVCEHAETRRIRDYLRVMDAPV